MSKEFISPAQFARVDEVYQDAGELTPAQIAELNELYEGVSAKLRVGELVQGTILAINSDYILVDISYKSDGMIPRYEFTEYEARELVPGASIDVILDELENNDGAITLSYEKAKTLKAWDAITKLFDENKPVEGVVTRTVKGGLSVDIGVPAFLPGSQVDTQRVANFEDFIGKKIIANVIKINKKRGNVIISRRKYLSERQAEMHQEIMGKLHVGQVVQGIAKNIAKYGVFVDIGGVDGLLHITDMTWGRISHPSKLVKIGDKITVQVLSIDRENNKISLGMKQLAQNPWQVLTETIQLSSHVKGRVSSITDYGLFVEIIDGVEGLVHISEISWTERISDLNTRFAVDQEIEAVVVSLDKDNRRMSLSIRQLTDNPWKSISTKFQVGQVIKGQISNITDFGIFIQLIPGVDGLAHISDLSWTRHIEHPRDLYQIGQEVEAAILSIDENAKKVSLGIKQLSQDPWGTIETEYPVNSIVEGEVSKITNFGIFVKLPNRIEGFVHISEFEKEHKKPEELVKVGDKRQFRIASINKDERKISMSLDLEGTSSHTSMRSKPAAGTANRPAKPATASAPKDREHKQEYKPEHKAEYKEHSKEQLKKISTPKIATKSSLQLALEKHAEERDKDTTKEITKE